MKSNRQKLATVRTFHLNSRQANELSDLLKIDIAELVDEDDLINAIQAIRQKALHSTSPTENLNLSRGDNRLIADAKKRRARAAEQQARTGS